MHRSFAIHKEIALHTNTLVFTWNSKMKLINFNIQASNYK
jgi:hypothetical protein